MRRDTAVSCPRRTPSFATVALAIAALIAAVAVVGCGEDKKEAAAGAAAQQRPAPQVTVMTVEPRSIPFTPSFVAQTESSQRVNIVARVSGFLDKIAYEQGEMVKEGQLMFQLDPKPFQAKVEAARGAVQSQQARLTTAQQNLARVKPLAKENALSQSDLDNAQGQYDAAKAALFTAQAELTEAQLNLSYTTIRAPVTGLASSAQQQQGSYINAQSADANLTYVAKVHPIWVNFSVSQNQTAKWREDRRTKRIVPPPDGVYEVDVVLSDGTLYPYSGKINFADPSFSQETGSFLVRGVLPNPGLELRPGMFVTAYLKGAMRPNAIVIPQLAVQQGPKGHFVYVIRADELAEIRPVIVGDYQGDKDIVILSGLGAGDRVVVDGVLKVVPGQPVKAIDAKLAGGAPAVLAPAALGAAGAGTSSTGAGEATAGTARGSARSPASIIPTEPPSGVPSSGNRSAENGALTETTRNAAALAGKAAASEPASRSASAQKAAVPRAPQAPAPPGPPIAAGSYGPVRDGETLIEISMRARPEGVSLDQTLVGIFRANPEAFDPDHHRLKSGATLAIPAQADLAAIDPRAAADEVRRAREKWAAEHRGK